MTLPLNSSATPHPKLVEAIAQFNRGEFFACHETLEELWLPATDPLRACYQGLIQVAAGLHHAQRGNPTGAATLLQRGRARLALFVPSCLGLDIAGLVAGVDAFLDQPMTKVTGGGRGFDRVTIPTVSWVRSEAGGSQSSPPATISC